MGRKLIFVMDMDIATDLPATSCGPWILVFHKAMSIPHIFRHEVGHLLGLGHTFNRGIAKGTTFNIMDYQTFVDYPKVNELYKYQINELWKELK